MVKNQGLSRYFSKRTFYDQNPSYPHLPWQVSIMLLVPAASTYTTISIQKARPWLVIYMLSAFLYFHFKGHYYASAFKAAVVTVDPALGRFAMQRSVGGSPLARSFTAVVVLTKWETVLIARSHLLWFIFYISIPNEVS